MTPFEKIVRPIVEGQIRGFLLEHPAIIEAVDWYKPRKDKSVTFTNSLAKRIVRDLISAHSQARIRAALLESLAGERPKSSVVLTCNEPSPSGTVSGRASATDQQPSKSEY